MIGEMMSNLAVVHTIVIFYLEILSKNQDVQTSCGHFNGERG